MLRARSTSRRTSSRARRLVEGPLAPGEHPRVADQVLDHRVRVGPVHLGRRQEAAEAPRSAAEGSRSPRRRGRGADEDEREDAVGKVEREQLRERPARRDADHVRGREPVGVEHADGVGDQVGAGVLGAPGLDR